MCVCVLKSICCVCDLTHMPQVCLTSYLHTSESVRVHWAVPHRDTNQRKHLSFIFHVISFPERKNGGEKRRGIVFAKGVEKQSEVSPEGVAGL